MPLQNEPVPTPPSRRRFLAIAGGLAGGSAAVLAGCTSADEAARTATHTATESPAVSTPSNVAVPAAGRHQAGVVDPRPPQAHLLSVVFDLSGEPGPVLARLGAVVLDITAGRSPSLGGLQVGDLTLTVGVGPRLVRSVDPGLPGTQELPAFRSDHLDAQHTGGDVLVQICATDPLVLAGSAAAVGAVPGLRERWRQSAFRGPNVRINSTASAPRNLLGFVDGIVGPRSTAQFTSDVWLSGPAPVAAGTIAVVRRMEIDLAAFLGLSVAAQEAVIGRRRTSAAPLTGGTIATDPDLGAKTPDGAYVIPADAHLRRANPVQTGVPPMLRRSYSIDDTGPGLLFVSFQNDLHTFTATMNRMSTSDALLDRVRTTRSGTFLILPGFDTHTALGATLFR